MVPSRHRIHRPARLHLRQPRRTPRRIAEIGLWQCPTEWWDTARSPPVPKIREIAFLTPKPTPPVPADTGRGGRRGPRVPRGSSNGSAREATIRIRASLEAARNERPVEVTRFGRSHRRQPMGYISCQQAQQGILGSCRGPSTKERQRLGSSDVRGRVRRWHARAPRAWRSRSARPGRRLWTGRGPWPPLLSAMFAGWRLRGCVCQRERTSPWCAPRSSAGRWA